jgi:FkbM family methyltransferase
MKRVQSSARVVLPAILRSCVAHAWSRKLLNLIYLKLSPAQRSRFHRDAAKVFRNQFVGEVIGTWKVIFHGKPVLMPLTPQRLWLDWDSALSIVGHDMEVKETYLALISSSEAPDLFLDIGANYGTHSLLFLIHHIEALTFEPNSACHAVFKELCEINHVSPQLEPVALGATEGYAELCYPERDTWDGSTSAEVANRLASHQELVVERVGQTTVDHYLAQMEHRQVLIKIDTEGNELNVLRGASATLRKIRPRIIFECWRDQARGELFDFLQAYHYEVHALPWSPAKKSQALGYLEFMESLLNNFIALPAGFR